MISEIDLASFDTDASAWVADAGSYTVKVGASSKDTKQTITFELGKELVVKQVNKALTPPREIKTIDP